MYKASIENRGDTRCFANTRHASFVLDTNGNGANPVDTLLASLCGCLSHYVRDYLVEHQISYDEFSINSEADATPDKAQLDKINVLIKLKDIELNEQQSEELLKFLGNCKVNKILMANPGVAISLG
jgi:uncharacterized OsmC-like protein